MQTDDVAVRVKPRGQPWQPLDADPQSPVLTANRWGPNEARLEVRRDPKVPWADLGAFTPIEVDIGGVTVWAGRIMNTPAQDGDRTIQISAQGWQYLLDDRTIKSLFVHTRLSDWKDWRTHLTADLSAYTAGWNVEAGSRGIIIRNASSDVGVPRAGVFLDLGQADVAKRVIIRWEKNTWTDGNAYFVEADDPADFNLGGSSGTIGGTSTTIVSLSSATTSAIFAATVSARYLMVGCNATTPQNDDRFFRIADAQVYGDTGYESANNSIFKSEQGIRSALTRGAPSLAGDLTLIGATTDPIPSFPAIERRSPRELIEALNAPHNLLLRVGADKRVTYKARPTAPIAHVGAWSNYEFSDASLNNGAELYDEAVVTGTNADGTPHETIVTGVVPLLEDTDGRSKEVTVEAPLTTAIATRIGQTFIDSHATSSLEGTLALSGAAAIRGPAGEPVHPSLLLLNAQELLRVDDRIDPDTGGVGRNGTIVGVTYQHADRSVEIECDNTRGDWDALLAKYNLVAGAIAGN